ncbi:MAG: 3-deoxy-D-manno-octulosonate 8-phosphate phosphatase [Chlorobiaceae bacterium]|nr:3-deoxy-D-manno-octulosonate 8-phosphate phosphatase [Chlorobiales bacterium]NTU91929.1 3-deoxy-D-manno-octulosonate 8-phosphate phosphatase [Chlorobiaceae bacterium]NTV24623.1 3-deoxy-D-manno-octulosonate 8-phosphate phosphatase [Chlorobiaceae bacterium]
MQPFQADPSSQVGTALDGIKALVFPIDGVLNNGTITLDSEGRELPGLYARDAVAIREALRCGLHVAVVSGRNASVYRPLLEAAGPIDLFLEGGNRLEAYETFKQRHGLRDEECACIADDIEELDILKMCGLPVTTINGVEYLRNRVAYISVYEGGRGCIREIVEMILEHQGKWAYGDKPAPAH